MSSNNNINYLTVSMSQESRHGFIDPYALKFLKKLGHIVYAKTREHIV